MIGVSTNSRLQMGSDAPHHTHDVALLVDFQRLECDCRGHAVRRISVAMAENAEPVALLQENVGRTGAQRATVRGCLDCRRDSRSDRTLILEQPRHTLRYNLLRLAAFPRRWFGFYPMQ